MFKPALAAVLFAFPAVADELADAAQQLASDCGANIQVSFDGKTQLPGRTADQGPVYCRQAIDGVRSACSDAVAKAGVGESVKTITCRLEAGSSKKTQYGGPAVSLEKGAMAIAYDWNTSNMDSELQKYVMKTMPVAGPNGPTSVEAKAERLEGEKQFGEAVAVFQKQCGDIRVTYDFASEKGQPARPAWQGYYYCRQVIQGLGLACEAHGKKAQAQKKFTSVECRFEKDASKRKDLDPEYQGAAHVLKGKTLGVFYDWANGNLDSAATKWLRLLK
jgi:hypothetical protein